MPTRRHISYAGRVQGVGFRATARDLARRFPITGWVRNEPDRTVTLEAQGAPDDLDAFLNALADAMGGRITSATHADAQVDPDETDFVIRR